MILDDARIIACGLLHDGLIANELTPRARDEIKAAIDRLLLLVNQQSEARNAKLVAALTDIANQQTCDEFTAANEGATIDDMADLEDGYDTIILRARAALALQQSTEKS